MHPGWTYTRIWFRLPELLCWPPQLFPFSFLYLAPVRFHFPTPRCLCRSCRSQHKYVWALALLKKKGSYVQWWQELISNFLHNDCIISSDSGNLAHITEAAGGCRSGWQLSSPEAPLTEIRKRVKEKCTLSLFTDAVSVINWSCPWRMRDVNLFFVE